MTNTTYLKSTNIMVTYLFTNKYTTSESRLGVKKKSGFTVYSIFKTYTFPNQQNYQQYLSSEPIFQSYLSLAINTKHQYIFAEFLEEHNAAKVDMIYQDIMYLLYITLSEAPHVSSNKSLFERDVLNEIQEVEKLLIDAMFKSHMSILYKDDNHNRLI